MDTRVGLGKVWRWRSKFFQEWGGLATSSWPKYRGNSRNTGQATGSGVLGEQYWSTAAGTTDRVEGSAIIGPDGAVYIGADDGRVYAFNGATGTFLWATVVQTAGVDSTPALGADGLLYVGAGHSVIAPFCCDRHSKVALRHGG
jgi:outer membrane protein assembly factor BamB